MKTAVKACEIFPLMGIHSQDTKHAGAWRLHVLAATLDREAAGDDPTHTTGKVSRDILQQAAEALGVKRSTFYTWLADARLAGILNGSGDTLYLASQEKLANILLCNSIDKSKTIIPLKLLFKAGWKSLVWAAYLKANHHKKIGYTAKLEAVYKGNVISAKTLEDLTGISPRTQRRYKKFIKSRGNVAITTTRGSYETAKGMNDESQRQGKNRHYFTYNDPAQKDPAGIVKYRRVIAHTLPARRQVSDQAAKIGARGRRVAILKGLRLVTVCNYSDCYYPARNRQAEGMPSNSEAKRIERRYFDELPRRLETASQEVFLSRRNHPRVWDRAGEAF